MRLGRLASNNFFFHPFWTPKLLPFIASTPPYQTCGPWATVGPLFNFMWSLKDCEKTFLDLHQLQNHGGHAVKKTPKPQNEKTSKQYIHEKNKYMLTFFYRNTPNKDYFYYFNIMKKNKIQIRRIVPPAKKINKKSAVRQIFGNYLFNNPISYMRRNL